MTATHIVVHGLVQGVGFRWSCQQEATRLGVVGWVRNLPDGTVELVADGAPDQVRQLVAWCHRGPRHARVDEVGTSPTEAPGGSSFEVR